MLRAIHPAPALTWWAGVCRARIAIKSMRRPNMDTVSCSTCGALREPELGGALERPPCPQCGGTALIFDVSIHESISVSDKFLTELVPGNQARDWTQRWAQVQKELQCVSSPRMEIMSGEEIHAWLQQLFSFYIQAYHLKDALKDAAPSLGLLASDIEDAITNDPKLALLADLANLDKHLKLTKPPRSGYSPTVKQVSGVDSATGSGWILSVQIKHGSASVDGLAFANDVVAAWQKQLKTWRIL